METIIKAILSLRPGAQWSFDHSKSDLSGLTWFAGNSLAAPTPAEIDAEIARLDAGPAFVELKAVEVAFWKSERDKMIARMTSIESQLTATGDTAGAASCRALRQSLLGLFIDPAVVAATTMSDLKAAFKARYKVATDLATTSAKLEFLKYES